MKTIEICTHLQAMLDDKLCRGEMTGRQVDAVNAALTALRRTAEDDKAREDGRLVVLSEPMLPMVEGKNPNDTDVYCPQCGHDLAGGWKNYDPDCEWKLCQCPNCGQSIDDTRVITRQEAEAALGGGAGD